MVRPFVGSIRIHLGLCVDFGSAEILVLLLRVSFLWRSNSVTVVTVVLQIILMDFEVIGYVLVFKTISSVLIPELNYLYCIHQNTKNSFSFFCC